MIEGKADTRKVDRGLEALAVKSGRVLPHLLAEFGKQIRRDLKAHQREQSGPDGPWPKLSPATVAQQRRRSKRGKGGSSRPLRKLPTLVTARIIDGEALQVRPDPRVAKIAAAHNFGAVVGHGARLPARDWFYVGDAVIDDFEQAIVGSLTEIWEAA